MVRRRGLDGERWGVTVREDGNGWWGGDGGTMAEERWDRNGWTATVRRWEFDEERWDGDGDDGISAFGRGP